MIRLLLNNNTFKHLAGNYLNKCLHASLTLFTISSLTLMTNAFASTKNKIKKPPYPKAIDNLVIYGGGGIGLTSHNIQHNNAFATRDKPESQQLYFGRWITQNIAVQASYKLYGESYFTDTRGTPLRIQNRAISLDSLLSTGYNQKTMPFVKIGLAYVNHHNDSLNAETTNVFNENSDEMHATIGAGIDFSFKHKHYEPVRFRLEANQNTAGFSTIFLSAHLFLDKFERDHRPPKIDTTIITPEAFEAAKKRMEAYQKRRSEKKKLLNKTL